MPPHQLFLGDWNLAFCEEVTEEGWRFSCYCPLPRIALALFTKFSSNPSRGQSDDSQKLPIGPQASLLTAIPCIFFNKDLLMDAHEIGHLFLDSVELNSALHNA